MVFNNKNFNNKSGSGLTFFLIALVALFVIYVFLQANPVALDNESSSPGLFSLPDFSNLSADSLSYKTDASASQVESFFCPEEACASQLIKKIDSAEKSIYVAIFSFTNDDIASALIRAKERGVEVKVVFDYDQSKSDYSDDEKLADAGIEVRRRDGSGYMHNKFCVIDEAIVSTGSFNYSENADNKNDENLLFIFSKDLAVRFLDEFNELWEQSLK